MKKTLFILSICVAFAQFAFSQLKVADNGNAGIKIGSSVPLSPLSIQTAGAANTAVSILAPVNVGINVSRTGALPQISDWAYSVLAQSEIHHGYHNAVYGRTYSSTPLSAGRSWGVNGYAGNATSGYNYGVMGTVLGTNYGAGVVGATSNNWGGYIDGIYAGYFVGNVKVTGTLTATSLTASDKRFKQNIAELRGSDVLNDVLMLNPVKYNLQQVYSETITDSGTVRTPFFKENSQLFQKKHFGLIAQELQEIYPELVYQEDNGYLAVDYVGIIPLLIQSVKELKAEIDDLKGSAVQRAGQNITALPESANAQTATLFQNNPNPFSQSTQIKYSLPVNVASASLCIYDLQGKQLKNYPLSTRGESVQIISASEFSAGIYLYALIADGKEIAVKRMILTE